MGLANVTSLATWTAQSTDASYPITNLTDGNTATRWKAVFVAGDCVPKWLQAQFTSAVTITRVRMAGYVNQCKDWQLLGSNNAATWTTIYTGQQTNDSAWVEHTITNSTPYLYYRINVISTWATNWSVSISEVELWETSSYKTSGSAIYTVNGITSTVSTSSISWVESKPGGTTLAVSISTDGVNYSAITNGGALLPAGTVLDNATIYIKVEMATTDAKLTPTISGLHFILQTVEDTYSIILEMEPLQRFESTAGPITVAYDGSGTLIGEGGAVLAFMQNFTPVGLAPKPHQNDVEHIEISSIAATGTLTKIYYTNTAEAEHIEITGITAVGTLTKVSDI